MEPGERESGEGGWRRVKAHNAPISLNPSLAWQNQLVDIFREYIGTIYRVELIHGRNPNLQVYYRKNTSASPFDRNRIKKKYIAYSMLFTKQSTVHRLCEFQQSKPVKNTSAKSTSISEAFGCFFFLFFCPALIAVSHIFPRRARDYITVCHCGPDTGQTRPVCLQESTTCRRFAVLSLLEVHTAICWVGNAWGERKKTERAGVNFDLFSPRACGGFLSVYKLAERFIVIEQKGDEVRGGRETARSAQGKRGEGVVAGIQRAERGMSAPVLIFSSNFPTREAIGGGEGGRVRERGRGRKKPVEFAIAQWHALRTNDIEAWPLQRCSCPAQGSRKKGSGGIFV